MEELQGVELERPLAKYAEALRGLSESSAAAPMRVKPLVQACYQALAFFNLLGVESHFWKADFVERLVDLEKASEIMETVEELVDRDVAGGCVRSSGSHSRNLVRVKRGVEVKRALALPAHAHYPQRVRTYPDFTAALMHGYRSISLQNNLIIRSSFDGLVSMAYAAVFARYHAKSVQSTVTDTICAIPVKSKTDLYRMINETEESATAEMQKYIDASTVVIRYIDELFTSRGLDTDW